MLLVPLLMWLHPLAVAGLFATASEQPGFDWRYELALAELEPHKLDDMQVSRADSTSLDLR